MDLSAFAPDPRVGVKHPPVGADRVLLLRMQKRGVTGFGALNDPFYG